MRSNIPDGTSEYTVWVRVLRSFPFMMATYFHEIDEYVEPPILIRRLFLFFLHRHSSIFCLLPLLSLPPARSLGTICMINWYLPVTFYVKIVTNSEYWVFVHRLRHAQSGPEGHNHPVNPSARANLILLAPANSNTSITQHSNVRANNKKTAKQKDSRSVAPPPKKTRGIGGRSIKKDKNPARASVIQST